MRFLALVFFCIFSGNIIYHICYGYLGRLQVAFSCCTCSVPQICPFQDLSSRMDCRWLEYHNQNPPQSGTGWEVSYSLSLQIAATLLSAAGIGIGAFLVDHVKGIASIRWSGRFWILGKPFVWGEPRYLGNGGRDTGHFALYRAIQQNVRNGAGSCRHRQRYDDREQSADIMFLPEEVNVRPDWSMKSHVQDKATNDWPLSQLQNR